VKTDERMLEILLDIQKQNGFNNERIAKLEVETENDRKEIIRHMQAEERYNATTNKSLRLLYILYGLQVSVYVFGMDKVVATLGVLKPIIPFLGS